jgi:hypothetical protein
MAKTESRRTVIATIRRNARENLEISLLEIEGRALVEIRRLFVPMVGEPRPMERDGLALSTSTDRLPELARAFADAERVAVARGMLPKKARPSRAA